MEEEELGRRPRRLLRFFLFLASHCSSYGRFPRIGPWGGATGAGERVRRDDQRRREQREDWDD
jgi:hypothetical protein